MKIGIFDPYLDDLGGGEKYMMTIAEVLSKNNNVSVFWDTPEDLKPLKDRFGLDLSKIEVVPNIFSRKASTAKRLRESKKYDEIIFLSDGSIPLVLSKKLFIHVQQPLKQFQKGNLKSSLKLSRVSLIFCNSEYTRSYISDKFGLKTVVLYPPVTLKPRNLKKENIILHVGRFRIMNVKFTDYKKQEVMVNVFKEMVGKGFKGWKLVMATSVNGPDKKIFEDFKKKAEGYPIEFLVNKSNDELWETYSKAKIYWHASGFGEDLDKNPEYAEHFGISTVEAMGAGVVPVVINAGGQKEIVSTSENGYLWDSLDELKDYTLKLSMDEGLLTQMSKKAKEKAAYFAEGRFENKVQKIFE